MKVPWVQGELREGVVAEKEADETVRLGVRKRFEQDGVDDAEDGAVGADAQRECKRDYDGESGVVDQLADRIAEILNYCFEAEADDFVALFLDARGVAELTRSRSFRPCAPLPSGSPNMPDTP